MAKVSPAGRRTFPVAVVIPTILRPELLRAVRSVYAQDLRGRVQILIGVDVAKGSRELLETLRRECPARMQLTVFDPGYSTSMRHGGIYTAFGGGGLRTILSYAANSRCLAYLDDDNWWAPSHLSSLLRQMKKFAWAFSYRWYVDPETQQPMFIDRWESLGPGKGMYAGPRQGGFVDTNCLMLDKLKCHWLLPAWCVADNARGAGADRVMFRKLAAAHPAGCTGEATAYYVVRPGDVARIKALQQRRRPAGGRESATAVPAGQGGGD